ncbi:hypothetical protein CRM22_009318 [Opisthorchis felineus]|uniref:Transmembrane protein 143 n=1 Tax=Opisthorchis felineus TaxID=147828 RepID=A0A4S2L7F2_OPIFE|nr:hypothetical protein CRM22_009318 [Opisthorchis felineus]
MIFRRALARTDRIFQFARQTTTWQNYFIHSTNRIQTLEALRNPPPSGSFVLKNPYIPLNRRTLIRELLQDSSVILPTERELFEQLAVSLDKKIAEQFLLLRNELALLSQVIEPTPASPGVTDHHDALPSTFSRNLVFAPNSNALDHEFWLLRRFAQLAPRAGFIEVTRDQLENACSPRRLEGSSAMLYIDPLDYDVIRFWVRGIHPRGMKTVPVMQKQDFADDTSGGAVNRLSSSYSRIVFATERMIRRVRQFRKSPLTRFIRSLAQPRLEPTSSPDDPCFSNVFMAAKRKQDTHLQLKLFDDVPVPKLSGKSTYVDNLAYLLPDVRFQALTPVGRMIVVVSSATALGCIGVVTPLAWLLTANPDLVIAWSLAATAGAAATASLVWARYWRARARLGHWLKMLHYQCGQTTGSRAVNSVLKLAQEEEFKAALLTYALLLRPSEAGPAINPTQVGIRAESWIAKRLSPKLHIPLPSSLSKAASSFTGGSGPLFDLVFDAERPIETLRRLDLVRGASTDPRVRPLHEALISIQDEFDPRTVNLSSLWIVDPLADNSRIESPAN